jgi:hypothetical protein
MKTVGSLRSDSAALRRFASRWVGYIRAALLGWYSPPLAASASNGLPKARAFRSAMIASARSGRLATSSAAAAEGLPKRLTRQTQKRRLPHLPKRSVGRLCLRASKKLGSVRRRASMRDSAFEIRKCRPARQTIALNLAPLAVGGGPAFEVDVAVAVPLHRRRERERGDHQAASIAKPLAKRLGLPYKAVSLTRIRPRPDKHLLSYEERWESLRGAFATRRGSQVDNLRVLLVDDVMTSGATLDSCAKALREAAPDR